MPLFIPNVACIAQHIADKDLGISAIIDPGLPDRLAEAGLTMADAPGLPAFERTIVDGMLKGFAPQITIIETIGGLISAIEEILSSLPTEWPGIIAEKIAAPVIALLEMLADWLPPSIDSLLAIILAPLQQNGLLDLPALGFDLSAITDTLADIKAKFPDLDVSITMPLVPTPLFNPIELFGLTIAIPPIPMPAISMPDMPSISIPEGAMGAIKMALGIIQLPLKILDGILADIVFILANVINPVKMGEVLAKIVGLVAKLIPTPKMLMDLVQPLVPKADPSALLAIVTAVFGGVIHLVGDIIGIPMTIGEDGEPEIPVADQAALDEKQAAADQQIAIQAEIRRLAKLAEN